MSREREEAFLVGNICLMSHWHVKYIFYDFLLD